MLQEPLGLLEVLDQLERQVLLEEMAPQEEQVSVGALGQQELQV